MNNLVVKQTNYLNNLNALRGIAATLTVIYHVDMWVGVGGGMLMPTDKTGIMHRMYLMVDFFFVLSGFIMYHVYGAQFQTSIRSADFWKFIRARFARVYPLHFLALFMMIGVTVFCHRMGLPFTPTIEVENSGFSVATNLLLLHSMNLHQWFTWVHASWSISTEWWMYLLFPFLMLPFSRLKSMGRIVVVLLCIAGYWAMTFVLLPMVTVPTGMDFLLVNPAEMSINLSYQYGFFRCMTGFILGMATYQYYREATLKDVFSKGYVFYALSAALLLCFHFNSPDAISVLLFPLLILCAAYGSLGFNRFLGSKIMQKLGDWSFSIYLVHQPLILFLFGVATGLAPAPTGDAPGGPPPTPSAPIGWLIAVVVVLLTVGLSYLSYSFWEKPLRLRLKPRETTEA